MCKIDINKSMLRTIGNAQQTGHGADRSHAHISGKSGRELHKPVDDADEQVRVEDCLRNGQQRLVNIIGRKSIHLFAHFAPQQGHLMGEHIEHRIADGVN